MELLSFWDKTVGKRIAPFPKRAEIFYSDAQSKLIALRRAVALLIVNKKIFLQELKKDYVSDLWTPADAKAFFRELEKFSPEKLAQQQHEYGMLLAAGNQSLNLNEYRLAQLCVVMTLAQKVPSGVITKAWEADLIRVARSLAEDASLAAENLRTLSKSNNDEFLCAWQARIAADKNAHGSPADESMQLLQRLLVALQSYSEHLSKSELQNMDSLTNTIKHLEFTQTKCTELVQTWTYRERMAYNAANEELALMSDFRRKGYERILAIFEQYLPSLY